MSVRKDPDGRRSVQAEVEVPGTPEQVWQAIATGPGISSWFVPAAVEEKAGGAVTMNFGPGMESSAVIGEWEPPHRFTADSQDYGPDNPTIGTEWVVEAQSGGTCIVRVIHHWFSESDDWDAQFEGHEQGWHAFFRILRLYLAHFPGQEAVPLQWVVTTPQPVAEAWRNLADPLGLLGAAPGQSVASVNGAPALAGVVERSGSEEHPESLLVLQKPTAGIAHLFPMPMGPVTLLAVRFYLFGEEAAAVAEREDAAWKAWMAAQFPTPEEHAG